MDFKILELHNKRVLPVSFSNFNIPKKVIDCQKKVFDKFELFLNQYTSDIRHSQFLDELLKYEGVDIFIAMDVDMIPLKKGLYDYITNILIEEECIIGIEQKCNCNASVDHIYAGPACLGITKDLYEKIGRPSFLENPRSDCAEEVTHRCQEKNIPVRFFKFKNCEAQKWELDKARMFGDGSNYEDRIYHQFEIRTARSQELFIKKCEDILRE